MAVLLIHPYQEFHDNNGNPLAGGKVFTYQAGTTTPKATFTDNTETVQASNPVILDSAGRATMWGAGAYKFMVYDANNVLIRTTDNVTTYVTNDTLGNSYFESFSGTGSQTVFTTSQNLGTDEKAIMVFVSQGLQQNVVNGDFATDTVWTKGTGWTIGSGVATATGAISTALSQTSGVTLIAGQSYNLVYTVTRSAGGIIPSIGGTSGTERTASGTYRETIIAGATQTLDFTGNAFTGTLDNISITPSDMKGYDIQSPTSYTINGTALTFGTAPAAGTGNIYIFAPNLLVAQANSSAAAADASASAANASAITAAAAAAQAALISKWRPAVLCATTVNITLSGEQTIDGQLTSSSRVLVKNQAIASENGVYVSAAGAWARATDADTASELLQQAVTVTAGSVNIRKSFANTNDAGFILGTDPVTWTELLIYPVDGSVDLSTATVVGVAPVSKGGTGLTALEATVASAGTVDLGAQVAPTVNVTGTTTITSFGTVAAGTVRRVVFVGALILTHNATSLIIPGNANITTAAGDNILAVSLGSGNWRVLEVNRAAGAVNFVKAWVNFNGTGTVSIRDSFNVSSITDNGVGDYTVNFSTALANANYAIMGSVGDYPAAGSTPRVLGISNGTAPSTTTCRLAICAAGTGGIDEARISATFVGN